MARQDIQRSVVVGVDGSESALRAVRWGAAEAARRQAPLRLVIAFGWTLENVAARPGLEGSYRDTLLSRAQGQLVNAVEAARHEGRGIEVGSELVVGSPIQVLGAEARHAQLVVIGDRGLTRLEGLLVGSVAIGLAAHASCPVVVVRGDEREPSDTASLPVLVGVDGSASSDAAIGFAIEAAAARSAPLAALHTWSDVVFDLDNAAVPPNRDVLEAEERQALADQVGVWADKFPDVVVELLVEHDQPARSLLEHSSRAQLVVVGSRGHGRVEGMVLGSVSNAVVHRAPCPVAVVHPGAQTEEQLSHSWSTDRWSSEWPARSAP
jgi:nucleotide-binding universal stress UspA family protein